MIEKYFSKFNIFETKVIKELSSLFKIETFQKNHTLLRQGDIWDKVFFVNKGLIRLYFVTTKGQEFNKNFFAEDSLIWAITDMIKSEPSLFFIDTLEESEILYCDYKEFKTILSKYDLFDKFKLPFYETLIDQKFTREYEFLEYDAKTRYKNFLEKYDSLHGRIPDYHLASYLGITNVTLSRIKKNQNF